MKAQELFDMEPLQLLTDLEFLIGCYYSHIPELSTYEFTMDWSKNTRVVGREIGFKCPDGRRIWHLVAITMDDMPVMLTQNAGREGDDHAQRFIVNLPKYREMVQYLMVLVNPETPDSNDVICYNEDRDDLDNFYGYSLDTYQSGYLG